ncbi:MAG: MOSC domain-containing protein [Gemmatimonadota bacterium]
MSDGRVGRIVGLQRSGGGVPKLPIERAVVGYGGIEGDWQRNRKHHGGPDRALCLYSMELIEPLVLEGHPIFPGAIGENVTISCLDWRLVQPGVRLRLGDVEVEATAFTVPCKTIAGAFADGRFVRVSEQLFPGWSRLYVRVLHPGEIAVHDAVTIG